MLTNHLLQAFHAIMANHAPELQRAKAASQRNMPVTKIHDCAAGGGWIAQVLRCNGECLSEGLAIGNVEAGAIEIPGRARPFLPLPRPHGARYCARDKWQRSRARGRRPGWKLFPRSHPRNTAPCHRA